MYILIRELVSIQYSQTIKFSEFVYLTSKGLFVNVKVPLAHRARGTNQKYFWRQKIRKTAEMVEACSEEIFDIFLVLFTLIYFQALGKSLKISRFKLHQ